MVDIHKTFALPSLFAREYESMGHTSIGLYQLKLDGFPSPSDRYDEMNNNKKFYSKIERNAGSRAYAADESAHRKAAPNDNAFTIDLSVRKKIDFPIWYATGGCSRLSSKSMLHLRYLWHVENIANFQNAVKNEHIFARDELERIAENAFEIALDRLGAKTLFICKMMAHKGDVRLRVLGNIGQVEVCRTLQHRIRHRMGYGAIPLLDLQCKLMQYHILVGPNGATCFDNSESPGFDSDDIRQHLWYRPTPNTDEAEKTVIRVGFGKVESSGGEICVLNERIEAGPALDENVKGGEKVGGIVVIAASRLSINEIKEDYCVQSRNSNNTKEMIAREAACKRLIFDQKEEERKRKQERRERRAERRLICDAGKCTKGCGKFVQTGCDGMCRNCWKECCDDDLDIDAVILRAKSRAKRYEEALHNWSRKKGPVFDGCNKRSVTLAEYCRMINIPEEEFRRRLHKYQNPFYPFPLNTSRR